MTDPRRPSDPFTTDPELLKGPALRADGTVEGKPPPEASQEPGPRASQPEVPLELDKRPAPKVSTAPMAYRPASGTRRPMLLVALIVVAIVGVGIGVWGMIAKPRGVRMPVLDLPESVRDALPEIAGPPILIESDPPGATIESTAGTLGATPWAGNNPFLTDTELTLKLAGYQSKKVKLQGAKEARIVVTLKKATR